MARVRNILFFSLIGICSLSYSQVIAPVKVVPARVQVISEVVEGHGAIQPYPQNDVRISPVYPMRIEAIPVKPGEGVQKGQLVVKLQRDQSIDVAVEKARVSLEQAKLNLQRAKKLFENGVIPGVKYEQAQTEYHLAKADYEIQQRSLDYAKQNSNIRSPIDGYVSNVEGAVGQIADPSQEILRIVNIKKLIARIGIEIEDIGKIKAEQTADITIPNLPDQRNFAGKVVRINKEIDPATQLVHIWIDLSNQDGILQPGMFAEARIIVKNIRNSLVVPRSAILKDKNGFYVFIIDKQKAKKVHVETGFQNDKAVQIIKGIQKGDQLVYLGNYELKEGMQVSIQK
ncbi:MAG: efflux RND transporter periplasmic adaptor subunit [Actinobacteria bacterium]|nr:efflux RND transporter periplasmic adaptor subunit [Actinomycetota bacterium]